MTRKMLLHVNFNFEKHLRCCHTKVPKIIHFKMPAHFKKSFFEKNNLVWKVWRDEIFDKRKTCKKIWSRLFCGALLQHNNSLVHYYWTTLKTNIAALLIFWGRLEFVICDIIFDFSAKLNVRSSRARSRQKSPRILGLRKNDEFIESSLHFNFMNNVLSICQDKQQTCLQ